MKFEYNPHVGSVTKPHANETSNCANGTCRCVVPDFSNAKMVYLHELTDECIERIADAVVRKLKEADHED